MKYEESCLKMVFQQQCTIPSQSLHNLHYPNNLHYLDNLHNHYNLHYLNDLNAVGADQREALNAALVADPHFCASLLLLLSLRALPPLPSSLPPPRSLSSLAATLAP